jgi:hypothetical protein
VQTAAFFIVSLPFSNLDMCHGQKRQLFHALGDGNATLTVIFGAIIHVRKSQNQL